MHLVARAMLDTGRPPQTHDGRLTRLGDEIAIELRYVEAIPREPNGKLRAVKSAVGKLA